MGNNYTQIHLQFVFAVKYRAAMIEKSWKDERYAYSVGIISGNRHKSLIVNGMLDHIHILLGMRPHQSISDLMQDIKGNSSVWINKNNLCKTKFSWQEGYGAFSYSRKDVPAVIEYIKNQELHHQKMIFTEEYKKFLQENEVAYDEKYVLTDPI